jgi:hypothetical protein
VGTGADALAASDAQLGMMIHDVPRSVVAHLDRAYHDAAVAINALVFQNLDNRTQGIFCHKKISRKIEVIIIPGIPKEGNALSNKTAM